MNLIFLKQKNLVTKIVDNVFSLTFLFSFQDSLRNEDILALLKDAILKILLEQPTNPLMFLRKHFKELGECLESRKHFEQWRK